MKTCAYKCAKTKIRLTTTIDKESHRLENYSKKYNCHKMKKYTKED